MTCPFPLDSDFAGMMRPGHNQSTPFGLSAAGRAPYTFSLQIRGREGEDENEDDSSAQRAFQIPA